MDNNIDNEVLFDYNDSNEKFEYEDNEEDLEETFLEEFNDDFTYTIQERGNQYYKENKIIDLYKSQNNYYAKVLGSNNKIYNVKIQNNYGILDYSCNCPYEFHCKHEYAVLIAISNKEYTKVELKKDIKEIEINLKEVIEQIPAEKIKEYLLSPQGENKVIFEINTFKDNFKEYCPIQTYEYYYNNLYNKLILNDDYNLLTNTYLNNIKGYIAGNNFNEVLKILKAIINAYNDSNKLNYDNQFIDDLPRIGMFLRVMYRKANIEIKNEINNWINSLKQINYYNNYYLEDTILSIHN